MRRGNLLVIVALLWGCTSVRPIDVEAARGARSPTFELAPGEGIVVLHIETAVPIAKLDLSQATAVTDLPKGDHLLFFAVSEGSHRWSDIVIPATQGNVRFRMYGEAWQFRVEAGRTNYPGNITIRGKTGDRFAEVAGRFRNQSAAALRLLRERFPTLIERYPPIYTGPGSDHFLEYFSEQFLVAGEPQPADTE